MTLVVFYWHSVKRIHRTALVFVVTVAILGNIGSSVRAGIVFVSFILVAAFGAAYFGGRIQLRRRAKLAMVIAVVLFVVGFFMYADFLTEKRQPGTNMLRNPITFELPLEDHILYKVLPETWHKTASVVAYYVSHGYSRLAQALNMPFIGIGFGIGNSPFLMRNVERFTGLENLKELSYGMRLDPEADLDRIGVYWSTFYTWIASDVTFWGVTGVVFFIGYFLALAWIDALRWHNPIAVVAFACLASLVFSFPRTNPMQDGSGLTVYLGLTLLWLLTRSPHLVKRCRTYGT